MRPSLHRIPRETKVAAVVLGAALLQVGVIAALGLRSTSERRRAFERELAERAKPVVRNVVREAVARIDDQETKLARELSRDDLKSPWERVRAAMESGVGPAFAYAYLVDRDGRLSDFRRPPFPPAVATAPDPRARARLAEVLRLERADPARAADAAQTLADDLARASPTDAVAAALALESGRRAAYASSDFQRASRFAKEAIARYAALRDDAGPLSGTEPFGPAASAVLCDVLYRSLLAESSDGGAFIDAVVDRREQAQRLRPSLSDVGYRVEADACARLAADATRLAPRFRDQLATRLLECDALDQSLDRASSVGAKRLAGAAALGDSTRFALADGGLLTIVPLRRDDGAAAAAGPIAAAFVAPPSALKAEAVEPAARAPALPEGLALVVRDSANRDVLDKIDGPTLSDEDDVAFGSAVPGLHANVALVDPSMLERETASARRLWLAILGGAALAVVAASLLAVRAVLREVRLARMKSDFVSNLSHELRTPLTSLRMFVETLREGRVRDEAEAKECLDVVAQETDRLQSLVERVLQFASFTRGRPPIDLKSADAGDVARRAVAVFRKRAEAARATIDLEIEDPLPESILDRDAVLQVLLNLLDNAVKYAGDNGAKIKVGVRPDGPAQADGGGGVAIEVEDDGPGVPERERELVFEEFYRGDDTLSRRVQGTGIGLAVARRIVLAHAGTIEVSRSRGLGGACFRVTLPGAAAGRRIALATTSGRARA